jgi:peptidoglycan hydrolase-like protein with peptidoglycan-binding domain
MQRRAGMFLVVLLAAPLFSFAQTLEDDDPNDRRYWGYSSRYQSQIDALGSTPLSSFPIPVFGIAVSSLTENFGDARGGGTRTHQGLDIMAKEGTPIASPSDAVVVRVGNGANSGLYIRTANPGGENLVYMHLSSIASGIEAGKSVKRGDIIGFVGNTGNASGGPAHLHLEVRQGGSALDPYPRLTSVFTQSEIDASIEAARAKGMTISYQSLAATTPVATPVVPAIPKRTSLVFGETNAEVTALQKFLILSPAGSAGLRLKNTGATGYFGPLTREALIEYQRAKGLAANGVVDEATYTLLFALQSEGDSSDIPTNGPGFTRDLELGTSGEDVRALQKLLNEKGFMIATSGVGAPGSESDYFGARTQAALVKYQVANSIAPAAGYFGPKTRAHIAR